jgi:hypothetical protein
MNIEEQTREALTNFFASLYNHNVDFNSIPEQRTRSRWGPDNLCGFANGVIEYGDEVHINELYQHLIGNPTVESFKAFINDMFLFYIYPFKTNNGSVNTTPSDRITSRPVSPHEIYEALSNTALSFTPSNFKSNLVDRDSACLFCFVRCGLEGAHIIAHKRKNPVYFSQQDILQDAGLQNINQVQNGLLLCLMCHNAFDRLNLYVDHDGQYYNVVVVEGPSSEEFSRISRLRSTDDRFLNRHETRLYFANNDASLAPNISALRFHKTACMIWHLAGGAFDTNEYFEEDDDEVLPQVPVDYRSKVINWNFDPSDNENVAPISN